MALVWDIDTHGSPDAVDTGVLLPPFLASYFMTQKSWVLKSGLPGTGM